jgi:hypothetical protein
LPPDIKPIATLKQGKQSPTSLPTENRSEVFTGLIVDATKIAAKPAMAPRILDEKGEEVYGAAFISREFAVQRGAAAYVTDLQTAGLDSRVGQKPLVAKALAVKGPQSCDIVISNADAARLRKFSEHLLFLKECRVVIVLSPAAAGDTQ